MTERMESVSKNDAQQKPADRAANVIGNAEDRPDLPKVPAFNFASYVLPEETKKSAGNERLTLDQFTRKVSSKNNLLFSLGIKGKSRFFALLSCCY